MTPTTYSGRFTQPVARGALPGSVPRGGRRSAPVSRLLARSNKRQVYQQSARLIGNHAYFTPVYRSLAHPTVYDVDAWPSEDDLARQKLLAPEPDPDAQVNPYLDRLQAHIAQRQEDLIERGWSYYQAGELRRAIGMFENAEMIDRSDYRARLGVFLACVSQDRVPSVGRALNVLERMLRTDTDLLRSDFDLADVLGSPEEVDELLQRWNLYVTMRGGEDTLGAGLRNIVAGRRDGVRAIYALLLWFGGERADAVREAARILEHDPDSAFAELETAMGDLLSEDLGARTAMRNQIP